MVDLFKMKAIIWDEASQGMKFTFEDIPADLVSVAQEWREKMVEAAAEATEELMNKYLETGDLSEEEIKLAIRQRTIATEIQPMLLRHRLQEQGRAAHARRRHRLPALAAGHPTGLGHGRDDQPITRQRLTTRSSRPWRSS